MQEVLIDNTTAREYSPQDIVEAIAQENSSGGRYIIGSRVRIALNGSEFNSVVDRVVVDEWEELITVFVQEYALATAISRIHAIANACINKPCHIQVRVIRMASDNVPLSEEKEG